MLAQRFQLRAEDQRAAGRNCVIERLLADAIACDEELASAGIPDGKSKHSAEMLKAKRTVLLISMYDRFGFRMRFELMAARFKLAVQFTMVVDLAVEDDRDLAVASGHRLTSALKINDRQPPHANRDLLLDDSPLLSRAAMANHVTHPAKHVVGCARVAMLISRNKSGDATHLIFSSGSGLH